jgi:hypothetical protein
MFYAVVFEYWTLVEVLLGLRDRQIEGSHALARTALKRVKGFARVFPIAKPASLCAIGLDAQYKGRHRAAELAYEQALAHAESLNMPYWRALAHFRLATGRTSEASHREPHLRRAVSLLSELGENYYLALAANPHDELDNDAQGADSLRSRSSTSKNRSARV